MNKRILCIALLTLTSHAFAATAEEMALDEARNMKMLEELGLPLPGSGIKVVPRKELNLTPKMIKEVLQEEKEIGQKGYVTKNSIEARDLLDLQKNIQKSFKVNKVGQTFQIERDSTDFRPTLHAIPLGFKYTGLEKNNSLKSQYKTTGQAIMASDSILIMGAVPTGGFHEKEGGWSGVCEFFYYTPIGNCSYTIRNVKVSRTAALLDEEAVTYEIHQKPTLHIVEGSKSSGFLYSIKWYDINNFHELECATKNYSEYTMDKAIELARTIDQ